MARACSSRYAPLIQLRKPLDDSALKKYPVIRPAVICAGMNRRDALVPIRLQGLHKGIRLRGKTVIDWDQAGVSDGRDGGRGGAVSVLRARVRAVASVPEFEGLDELQSVWYGADW
jgi:hypothetical protein